MSRKIVLLGPYPPAPRWGWRFSLVPSLNFTKSRGAETVGGGRERAAGPNVEPDRLQAARTHSASAKEGFQGQNR